MTYSNDNQRPRRNPFAVHANDNPPPPDWYSGFLPADGVPNLLGYPNDDGLIARRSRLHRGRFKLNGLTYDARGLDLVENVPDGEQVEVRIDLSDLSSAWIEDPLLGEWFPVRCVQTRYARGVSFAAHLRLIEDYVRSDPMPPPWHEADGAAGSGLD
ncbi:hypothetical protein [Lichenifustis flavocetrariae]|uniref:Uncharacterized protein n=1 Tax=Lichenifustis flavocetrariae TaxID=2949735 RepID=A0AA41YXC6_9HYPH|nr:hypothetical protein [Lichenifustis flavocetrariae]MCW6509864.1 hypothetical protein [Lichenifustis flavocetrariae]